MRYTTGRDNSPGNFYVHQQILKMAKIQNFVWEEEEKEKEEEENFDKTYHNSFDI
jgi:hypothetical protein